MQKIIPVIMSGGAGSRLWPLSRSANPKQLLPLVTENTMIQETVMRLTGDQFLPPVFICNTAHVDQIQDQMHSMNREIGAIITEPFGRNTAPCAVAAALHALDHQETPLVLLLPADHHVKKPDAFREAIIRAIPAAQSGRLVTFGISAESPETGYGYIERGAPLDSYASEVKAFHEKPDAGRAQSFIDDGGYAWNGGIFLFPPNLLMTEIKIHAPDIEKFASRAYADRKVENGIINLDPVAFEVCPSESIDYAIMEPTKKAAMVSADIGWTDIGSFAALHEELKQVDGNAIKGDVLTKNTTNCLIQSDGPLIATVGVEGLSIIVKDGKVLIASLEAAQDVKAIVTALKLDARTADL